MDPNSLNPDPNTDPDPAFEVNPDADDQKMKQKKYSTNFFLSFDQKLQFTYVQATGEAFSPEKEHPAFQEMKFINFFLCL